MLISFLLMYMLQIAASDLSKKQADKYIPAEQNNFTEQNRIKPYSENGYYWQYKGQPIILIGGSYQDNPFNHPNSLEPGTTLEEHLDIMVSVGGNYIRNTMSHRDPTNRDDPPSNVFPFLQDENGLFDLELWNEEYWNRFDRFLSLCEERDIIVQVEIWATYDYHNDNNEPRTGWINHPYNPDNNINYTSEESGLPTTWTGRAHATQQDHPFFRTPPELDDNIKIREWQEAFVDKLLSISLNYGNVLYVMNNETSALPEWGDYWIDYVRRIADQEGVSVEVTDMRERQNILDSTHDRFFDQPDMYDFIEISQNNWQDGDRHWDRIQERRNQISTQPRPLNNTKIYGADPDDRTGGDQAGIERFWRNLIGGAASQRFHRPPSGIGLNEKAQANIKSARMLIDHINLYEASPGNEILTNRSANEAYATSISDYAYAVYFPNGGSVDISLENSPEEMILNWLDIESSEWQDSETITHNGNFSLQTPGPGSWVAIISDTFLTSNPFEENILNGYRMSLMYPNPFWDEASFILKVEQGQNVVITITNIEGRRVGFLHEGWLEGGQEYQFTLNAVDMVPGLYLIQVVGEDFNASAKVTLIR